MTRDYPTVTGKKRSYSFSIIFIVIFSARGIAILAKGIDIAVPANADLINATKKPVVNPKFIATMINAMGTDMKTAAKHENKMFLYFLSIFIKIPPHKLSM
jgi:hypothetical protein